MATFNAPRSAALRVRRMRRNGLEELPAAYDLARWRERWEAAGVPVVWALTHAPERLTWKGAPLEARTDTEERYRTVYRRCDTREEVLIGRGRYWSP